MEHNIVHRKNSLALTCPTQVFCVLLHIILCQHHKTPLSSLITNGALQTCFIDHISVSYLCLHHLNHLCHPLRRRSSTPATRPLCPKSVLLNLPKHDRLEKLGPLQSSCFYYHQACTKIFYVHLSIQSMF